MRMKKKMKTRKVLTDGKEICRQGMCCYLTSVFFCQRNTYRNKRVEPSTNCVEDRAVQLIRFPAEANNDFAMLDLLSNDIIASEAKYHSSCYKIYTKLNSNVGKATSSVSKYKEIEIKAFREVLAYCHELTTSTKVVPF